MPELVIYWFNGNRKPLAKIPLPLQTTHPPKKNPGYGPAYVYIYLQVSMVSICLYWFRYKGANFVTLTRSVSRSGSLNVTHGPPCIFHAPALIAVALQPPTGPCDGHLFVSTAVIGGAGPRDKWRPDMEMNMPLFNTSSRLLLSVY